MPDKEKRQYNDTNRPVGFQAPSSDAGLKAWRAIEENRLPDAKKHAAVAPNTNTIDQAWTSVIEAKLAVAYDALSDAQRHYESARDLLDAADNQDELSPSTRRLLATALMGLGTVYRRQDRPAKASPTHQKAFELFSALGSIEEAWACAHELGLDADIHKRYDQAITWFKQAVELAGNTASQPAKKQAITWNATARSFMARGLHERSVQAARSARKLWHRHDHTAVCATHADAALGEALVKLAEHNWEANPAAAMTALDESIVVLENAVDSLRAFGPSFTDPAQLCSEHLDFARRLRESLKIA